MTKESALESFARNIYLFENAWHYNLSCEYTKKGSEQGLFSRNRNRALFMIEENEGMISSDIAKYLEMKKGSITTLVRDLEKKGYIYKEKDLEDKRKIWIRITDEGKQYTKAMNTAYAQALINIFGEIEEQELEEAAEAMNKVLEVMGKAGK